MHSPKETHLKAVYRTLHYLKGTPSKGILFKKGAELSLEAYTDVDYAGSPLLLTDAIEMLHGIISLDFSRIFQSFLVFFGTVLLYLLVSPRIFYNYRVPQ